MKKTHPTLVLRSETIRTLVKMELAGAIGGLVGTNDKSDCVVAVESVPASATCR